MIIHKKITMGLGGSALIAAVAALANPLLSSGAAQADQATSGPGTSSAAAAGPPQAPSAAAKAAPGYDAAIVRPQTAEEQAVQGLTPASDTRRVTGDGDDDIFVGRVDAHNALCISVQNRQSQRLTTTCGDASAIQAGQLLLTRGGDGRNLVIGVAPSGSASVTLKTRASTVTAAVDGGLFHARPDSAPIAATFTDQAGAAVASVATPGAP
jgi:hypothetical protein